MRRRQKYHSTSSKEVEKCLLDVSDFWVTEEINPIPLSINAMLADTRAKQIERLRKKVDVSAYVARKKFEKDWDEGIKEMGRACHAAVQSRINTDPELEKILKELNEMVEEEKKLLEAQEKLLSLNEKSAEDAGETGGGEEAKLT